MKMYYLFLKVVVPLLFMGGSSSLTVFSQADDTVFSLHYTVDQMTHEKVLSGAVPEDYLDPLPQSVRYSMTYHVKTNGNFFLEIFLLDSPWETILPHEIDVPEETKISRMLIKPGLFQAFDDAGRVTHQQAIDNISLPADFFSDGFDPLAIRDLLLKEENPTNRKLLLSEKGGVELENGFISIQSCGQTGPVQISCDPGVCTRIIYDPDIIRPILAEHSKAGEPPFHVQYMKWSKDGRSLEKSFEREVFTTSNGIVKALETVSHYHNFSMKN